jgi:hypothetical protein
MGERKRREENKIRDEGIFALFPRHLSSEGITLQCFAQGGNPHRESLVSSVNDSSLRI